MADTDLVACVSDRSDQRSAADDVAELMDRYQERAVRAAHQHLRNMILQHFDFATERAERGTGRACESPIEWIFEVSWVTQSIVGSIYLRRLQLERQVDIVCDDGTRYRADFAVRVPGHPATTACDCDRLLVELDGHEWHERTPEQVAQRNQRDRRLQANGYLVFHFSGTELLRDPGACVAEVESYATVALINCDAARRATTV